jgi:hypothetical protein
MGCGARIETSGFRSTDPMNGFNHADRPFEFILLTVREWLEWGMKTSSRRAG